MNRAQSPDSPSQAMPTTFTKVFTFRPAALGPYLLAWAAVIGIMGFFMWVAAQWELLTLPVFCWLSLPVALVTAYTLYLWVVMRTATLVVTEQGVVYRDRWVRRALRWSDIAAITPFALRSKQGRSIALRLGVKGLNNWQELVAIAREQSDAAVRL